MSDPLDDAVTIYEEHTVEVREGAARVSFRCRLMRPATIEPGRRYPVVLFLHGAGERGTDNRRQLAYLPQWMAEPAMRERYPCHLVAPQCRPEHRWVDVPWGDAASAPHSTHPTTDLAAAVAALDAVLTSEAADPGRTYLTGLSMGGFGAWDLAARTPQRFAAVLPICGGGDEATAERLATLPVWCFHGADDTVVLPERSRRMIAAIRKSRGGGATGPEPRYSELAGVGHDAWTPAYRDRDVLEWLFGQRR